MLPFAIVMMRREIGFSEAEVLYTDIEAGAAFFGMQGGGRTGDARAVPLNLERARRRPWWQRLVARLGAFLVRRL